MDSSFTYRVAVLGCKVNQYEAQQIRRLLDEAGGSSAAAKDEPPQIIVVHSCAVTANAVRKTRQALRQWHKRYPQALLIASGCAVATPNFNVSVTLQATVPPGPHWLHNIRNALSDALPNLPELSDSDLAYPLHRFQGHTRAFIKIQDGCLNACSYCIVPTLRRHPRSKPLDMILEEARQLVRNGYKELVISGVSVGFYAPEDHATLPQVMQALADLPGVERLRLSSLHPADLTDDLLKVWSNNGNIMPHIHLPIQSGSDTILQAMNRGYSRSDILHAADRAKACLDHPAFNTDVIVGFPGETEQDFADTVDCCRQVGFSRMHIFPFSPRPGTAACNLPGQLDGPTVQARCHELKQFADQLAEKFALRFLNQSISVLTERALPNGMREGYSRHYLPVRFHAPNAHPGDILTLTAQKWQNGQLLADGAGLDA
jgi:threonylcarbamoyladenosine tRNA methylthiotransferase MtaB